MSFVQAPKSDEVGTVVYSVGAVDGTIRVTSAMDVRSFREVDFTLFLTSNGTLTSIDFTIESSDLASPSSSASSSDWGAIRIDNIDLDTGISDMVSYTPREAIVGPVTIPIIAPVRGRWMRLKFVGAGTGAGSINAFRRI